MKTIILALLVAPLVLSPAAVVAGAGDEFAELLGVHLGKETRIADVQKHIGDSPLIETGEAGEYEASVCYFVGKCGATVKFWSGELGGPEHDIIGFTLARSADRPAECSLLAISDCQLLHLAEGIRLGIQPHQFIEALGGKVETKGDWIRKAFERRQPMTAEEHSNLARTLTDLPTGLYWDISVYVQGHFQDGALQTVKVSKTQTF